jgi:hypothetical protein
MLKPLVPIGVNRQAGVAAQGLRRLTKSEAAKLGVSARYYTSQKAGVKRLDRSKVVTRRAAETPVLGQSFDAAAKVNRERRGGRSPLTRYKRYRQAFQASHPGMGAKEVMSDPEFQRLYAQATSKSRTLRATAKRLEALKALGLLPENDFTEMLASTVTYEFLRSAA